MSGVYEGESRELQPGVVPWQIHLHTWGVVKGPIIIVVDTCNGWLREKERKAPPPDITMPNTELRSTDWAMIPPSVLVKLGFSHTLVQECMDLFFVSHLCDVAL